MQIKNIFKKIGFTEAESRTILFLVVIFIAGLLIRYFKIEKIEQIKFDYSTSDSLFLNSGRTDYSDSSTGYLNVAGIAGSKTESYQEKKKELPPLNSININQCSVDDLMKLPGIGQKTAEKIIEYRKKHIFKSVEGLTEVSGIGNSKLDKIKKFIFVK